VPPNPADLEKLLRFFQDLYAHTLTLQEFTRTEYPRSYDDLKPPYEQQAAEKFEIFYRSLNEPEAFARAVREFLESHPGIGKAP